MSTVLVMGAGASNTYGFPAETSKELEAVGDARKRGSRWGVRLEAAKEIAVKRRTPSLAGLSIEEMVEVLAQ